MENAVEALKMGFAVLVLIAALSLAIFSFTRVRETSAQIAEEADIQEYYQQLSLGATGAIDNNALSSRVVGVETIIPTLYRYYKENYTILFYVGRDYNSENGTFSQISPMPIYYTETNASYLTESTLRVSTATNERRIYGFDIQDEQVRREPWSANQDTSYKFIEAFVNGLLTENYYTSRRTSYTGRNPVGESDNGPYYQIDFTFHEGGYDSGGLLGKNYKFVERYGEYNYENINNSAENNEIAYNILSNVTSSVDIYEDSNGGQVAVENNRGTTKRVIQYIYIANEV